MSRLASMARFDEPWNEPEFYKCMKCGEVKPAREFDTDQDEECTECKNESDNDPSSATAATERNDYNQSGPPPFAEARG